jgi:hypothetical protein
MIRFNFNKINSNFSLFNSCKAMRKRITALYSREIYVTSMKIQRFLEVMPCGLVNMYRRSEAVSGSIFKI